jgi:hypothetical protein
MTLKNQFWEESEQGPDSWRATWIIIMQYSFWFEDGILSFLPSLFKNSFEVIRLAPNPYLEQYLIHYYT